MCRLVEDCYCESCVECRDATREQLVHRLHMALRQIDKLDNAGPARCACGRMKLVPGQGQDARDYEGWVHRVSQCDRPGGAHP